MPYKKTSELPENVRNHLPAPARRIFMKAFNAADKKYKDEVRAFRISWGAVKKVYEKRDGKWVEK